MTSAELPDGSLLMSYDSRTWSRLAAATTVAFLAVAAYDYFIGARGDDRLVGLLGAAGTMAVTAIALSEHSRFRFDPARREITWTQRFAFRRRSGTVRFDDVRHVAVERSIGDRGVPNRRVVLHLADGTSLPVTHGYRSDIDDVIPRGAERIRRVLGHHEPTTEETARVLVEGGRTFEAVQLLRDGEDLSLTDAKKRIKQLKRK